MNWKAAFFQAFILIGGISIVIAILTRIIVYFTAISWLVALKTASAIFFVIALILFLVALIAFHE